MSTIVETVKDVVADARSKLEMFGAHGQEVLQTGVQTLQAAKDVVAAGGRDAVQVLSHTGEELQRTLKDGAAQIGEKLSRIATPTRKEQAASRKAEVKARKQQRQAGSRESAAPTAH